MPAKEDGLKDRLSQADEINITVTGRKSGRAISLPIWFVLEGDKLYLLPVKGSETQWYENVLKNRSMTIAVGDANVEVKAEPITDGAGVASVVEKFHAKYGVGDVKKYYSKFDVAVTAELD
jgi:hypothetical protein